MKYTITQASNILNCKPYLLRFYEDEFELKIPRSSNNRRYYTTKEIDIFRYIEALKGEGKKNKEIKETLTEGKEKIIFEEIEEENPVKEENNITCLIKTINSLREEIESLKQQDTFKQRDELIAENARLKMKLKERTYEVSVLKEKYNALKQAKKRSLFRFE
ncbi:MerR family transcriptional regulator [Anaerofustis sp.]|uniref:MerR family transcriptional regulator n=1 Tax=Anaerofustis sp. TaxID=1872517 RepID=UPI0025C4C09D|nr:MerR family transcriptional regulator [Anaerofustis sp.]